MAQMRKLDAALGDGADQGAIVDEVVELVRQFNDARRAYLELPVEILPLLEAAWQLYKDKTEYREMFEDLADHGFDMEPEEFLAGMGMWEPQLEKQLKTAMEVKSVR